MGQEQGGGRARGGETPFELDATDAAKAGENLLAVRVLNPGHERIDDIVLGEIPHRTKSVPSAPGNGYNYGGILLPVELVVAPAVRVADVYVRPDGAHRTRDLCKRVALHIEQWR